VVGALERVNQCSQQSDRRTPFYNPTPPPAELEVDRRWGKNAIRDGQEKAPARKRAGAKELFPKGPEVTD
jgi:hypothetical protein